LKGRYESSVAIDSGRLDETDAAIYLRRVYYFHWRFYMDSLERLGGLATDRVRMVRHEDMHHQLEALMRATAQFLGIAYHPSMLTITFGGQLWWGDKVYDMKPTNEPNPRVVSGGWKDWLPTLDWFVLEGLFHDYCRKYGYGMDHYKRDNWWNRAKLFMAMLLPSVYERRVLRDYFRPSKLLHFLHAARHEANGETAFKEYGFNAYYRHKWTNVGLRLWQPRWYRRLLDSARTRTTNRLILGAAGGAYVTANLVRYLGCWVTHPVWIAKRGLLSAQVFLRLVRKSNVLPDPMV